MREEPPIVLLESVKGARAWNYAPGPAVAVMYHEPRTGRAHHRSARGIERSWDDPLEALAWMSSEANRHGRARWVGYLSYDLGRLFERITPRSGTVIDHTRDWPLFVFTLHDEDAAHGAVTWPVRNDSPSSGVLRSTFSRSEYEAAVERVIEYIAAGDVFQVNLSQRFTAPLTTTPLEIYRRLRQHTPAEYGALVQYGGDALICNSPELFLRVTPDPVSGKRRIVTRPIKGTRPRGAGMEAELRDSPKDAAELNMIVDLERNDLGRVCEIGSVRVTEPRAIEAHPTVYHGVATIEGTLRKDVTFVDLLRATFPGGSVTGAPKIRAMEIIEELEHVRRGPYCGAIGYLGPGGSMEFNIAIRTMLVRDGEVHIPVGGGVVADSVPAAEYEETIVKARAMFRALGIDAGEVDHT